MPNENDIAKALKDAKSNSKKLGKVITDAKKSGKVLKAAQKEVEKAMKEK